MRLQAVLQASTGGEGSFSSSAATEINKRGSVRRTLTLSAVTSTTSAGELPVLIRDISQHGLLIEAGSRALSAGDIVNVPLPENGHVKARVAWASGPFFGCQFDAPISPGAVSATLLKSEPRTNDLSQPRDDAGAAANAGGSKSEPELNFAVPFYLSLAAWVVIGLIAYIIG